MAWTLLLSIALLTGLALQGRIKIPVASSIVCTRGTPSQAQIINQKNFNVLPTVPPPIVVNGTQIFRPPGISDDDLLTKPFHIYDDEFYWIIGCNPTLTLIASSEEDPLFHEAVVWYPPTDEVFFVQNAGAPAAGTGLAKSAIIQKISLSEVYGAISESDADAATDTRDVAGKVTVYTVDSNPTVVNPNGATNYKGQILFMGEGAGPDIPSAIYVMNPRYPYNTSGRVLLNNYFGRQFNSLNDVAIHPRNKDIYFTDTLYGYLQDFRPAPGIQNQVYRLNDKTGAVTVLADGFTLPNGIAFSPDGHYAYVTDTGIGHGFQGWDFSHPASIYRFEVKNDGTWENRKTFAFVDSTTPDGPTAVSIPVTSLRLTARYSFVTAIRRRAAAHLNAETNDIVGIHCDSNGNVYAGCGDGVNVWNPSGKLIGKIYLGTTAANFQFAGDGRMVICAETKLYYATLKASGACVDGMM